MYSADVFSPSREGWRSGRDREQNGKQTEAKRKEENFLPLQMEDLSEPAEPSVSARFSHHYQKERKRGERKQKGWVETEGG